MQNINRLFVKTYMNGLRLFYCRVLIPVLAIAFSIQAIAQSNTSAIAIPAIQEQVMLDGRLEENAWLTATEIRDFMLIEPRLNGEPTEKATARFFYTDKYLFVGIHCPNQKTGQIYAQIMERDVSLDADDYAEVQLDTYNDRTNALVFRTNPLGTRFDYEISNNGENINNSWNTFWDVSTYRDDKGWTAEFRIPFFSLRFQQSVENTMRIKIIIKYKMINEKLMYPLINQQVVPVIYNFQNAKEIFFRNLKPTNPVFVTPYIKADVFHQNQLNTTGTAYHSETHWLTRKNYSKKAGLDKMLSNAGVDIKYRINNNNVLDVSLNTDFAQVEADDRLINVTRFSINLPEKRPFFLENADIFNSDGFSHRLFNSRAVGIDNGIPIPIIGGLRFNGFKGKNQYGVLSVLTSAVSERQLAGYSMNVLRARRILDKKGSNIGMIATGKIAATGNDHNYLTAIDGLWRWKNNTRIFYLAGATFDKEKGNLKPVYGIGVNTFQSNGFGVEIRYREYTRDFNPELGFVSEPNTKRITINTGFRRTYKQHPYLSYFTIGYYLRKSWQSSSGRQDIFQTNIYINAFLKKGFRFGMFVPLYIQDYIYTPWKFSTASTIPIGTYKMWKMNPFFNTGTAYRFLISLDVETGQFYGGKQFTANFSLGYDVNKNVRVEAGGSLNRFSFPDAYMDNGISIVHVNRLFGRLKLAFSNKTFLNLYTQYDNVQKSLGWNFRFRHMPKEGTDFYIVYTLNSNTEGENFTPQKPFVRDQLFILKFSKTLIW